MIKSITLWRYRLPLNSPIVTIYGELHEREGLLIQWHYVGGSEWSEVCPLPGFSQESLSDALKQLLSIFDSRHHYPLSEAMADSIHAQSDIQLYPSVKFGLEMGLMKLFSPLAGKDTPLAISGLITDETCNLQRFAKTPVIKVKVGRNSVDNDINHVNALLSEFQPPKMLRLDANRSWSLEQAQYFFSQVSHQQIEFIEEPLQKLSDYQIWDRLISVPFAFDEQLQKPEFKLSPIPGLNTIVIKPMLIGLKRSLKLIEQANRQEINTVISSAYESSLTLNFLYQLAQTYTPNIAPGLDTFKQNKFDVIEPLSLPRERQPAPLIQQSDLEKIIRYDA